MNEFTFFADLFQNFDTAFLASVQRIVVAMAAAVRAPLTLAITIYLGATAAMEIYSPGSDPFFMFVRRVMRAVIVLAAVTGANYTDTFVNLFMTTLPNELTAAVTQAGGAGLAPNAFDKVSSTGFAAGVAIWMASAGFWSTNGIGIVFLVGAYWVLSAICVVVAFLVFIASHILIGLLVCTGPLVICFLLWPRTTRYFDGWVSALLASVFTQVAIVILLTILIDVETLILQQVIATNGGANMNQQFGQIRLLLEGGSLFFSMAYLATHVRSLAYSIWGGASAEISPISRMVTNALSTSAAAGSAGAQQAAAWASSGASSAAAGLRSIIPVGRRLGP